MGAAHFSYTGALDPDLHAHLYVERDEDHTVRQTLTRVGTECVLISLIGARQTGKTSLLNRLHHEYHNHGWLTVQLDLSELSEFEGEVWYSQLIAQCCEQFQQCGLTISEHDLASAVIPSRIPPYTARGWSELLRMACAGVANNQRVLISLDEISSVPSQQWEPFFSMLRAIHQAASAPQKRPEYRKLGVILAGAFVPAHLINIVEKSPFNVSTKVYMSQVTPVAIRPLLQLLVHRGVALDQSIVESLHEWSGGLLYHVQRICDILSKSNPDPLTVAAIERIAQDICFDDAYLSHIVRRLHENQLLKRVTQRILKEPLQSNRNEDFIATLEVSGVIRYDPAIERWRIVNRLCETFLYTHIAMEGQTMTGLETIAAVALTKAVDFLFDQAGKLMEERRENRKKAGESDEAPAALTPSPPTTKEEVQSWQPQKVMLKDTPQEIEHALRMLETYRRNKRNIDAAIAAYGSFTLAPRINQNELLETENNIKDWSQKLKGLVEQAYGRKIMLIGLD